MSNDQRRMESLRLGRMGIYGYSGDSGEVGVRWRHQALGFCNKKTLEYYTEGGKYRGLGICRKDVDRYGEYKDPAYTASSMKRRPMDKPEKVVSERPISTAVKAKSSMVGPRATKTECFGAEISADTLGSYNPLGYGGVTTAILFVDPFTHPPLGHLVTGDAVKKKMTAADSKALSSKALKDVSAWYQANDHSPADEQKKWNDPVATIRSDYGTEFISKDYVATAHDLKIRQKWGTPHAHEQNGVVERYVQQLFVLVTACYAAASWAPRHLWMYAIAHMVHCLSLQVGDDKVPPWEQFYGERYNFRKWPLMPWGCIVQVFIPKHLRSWKFGEHAIPAMYLGCCEGIKEGILVYVFLTKKVRIAREYIILPGPPTDLPCYNGQVYPARGDNKAAPTVEEVIQARDVPFIEDDYEVCRQRIADEEDANEPRAASREEVVPLELTGLPSESEGDQEVLVEAEIGDDMAIVPNINLPVDYQPPIVWQTPQKAATAAAEEVEHTNAAALKEAITARGMLPADDDSLDNFSRSMERTEEVVPEQLEFNRVAVKPLLASIGEEVLYTLFESSAKPSRNLGNSTTASTVRKLGVRRINCISNYQLRKAKARVETHQQHIKQKWLDLKDARHAAKIAVLKRRNNPDKPSLYTALRGKYAQQVKDAMDAEISQYVETFGAMEVMTEEQKLAMSPGDRKNALTSHFEIEYKRDNGAFVKVKARLVIHGNQTHKYSFDEVKSPTARQEAVKLMMAMMAKRLPGGRKFTGRSWDVQGAFLQNNIDERTAVKQSRDNGYVPPQAIHLRLPDSRYAVLRSYVYGLKQASYEWYSKLVDVIMAAGFVPTSDPCVFHMWDGQDVIIISVHVDDIFAIATNDRLHDLMDAALSKAFEGTDAKLTRKGGPKLSYLKMNIEQLEDGTVTVDQSAYLEKVIKQWGHGKVAGTAFPLIDPSESGSSDHPMQETYAPQIGDESPIDPTWYRGVIGAINYAAIMTRPDLLFAMSILSAHTQAPTKLQQRMVKRVMKYIVGTKDLKLTFKADEDWQLVAWADASFATRESARSQTGYCFALGKDNASFYAKSQKQNLVTLSSTEAEYVALFHTVTEAVYIRRLLEELGFPQLPTIVFQDNQSTILWSLGQQNHKRTKHISIKYHYIEMLMQDAVIELEYLPTDIMRADLQTKPIVNGKCGELTDMHMGK